MSDHLALIKNTQDRFAPYYSYTADGEPRYCNRKGRVATLPEAVAQKVAQQLDKLTGKRHTVLRILRIGEGA